LSHGQRTVNVRRTEVWERAVRTAICAAMAGVLLTAALVSPAAAQEHKSTGAWPTLVNAAKGHTKLALAAPPAHRLTEPTGTQLKNVVIDVMVAYTKKSARSYSDIEQDLIALAIEETNESFRASNLGHIKLRLVH